jgi:hypothetical protein
LLRNPGSSIYELMKGLFQAAFGKKRPWLADLFATVFAREDTKSKVLGI